MIRSSGSTGHDALHAPPRQRLKILHPPATGGPLAQTLGNRPGYRMIRLGSQRSRALAQAGLVDIRHQRLDGHQHRPALGEGAGLVQCHGPDPAGLLQMDAALDEDAAPGCGRQATDHRHRRGNDQRARAGDHQQHQRLIERLQGGGIGEPRQQHRHGQRQSEHGRRVARSKAVDETLGGRATGLRLLDGIDDARQHAVTGGCRRPDLEQVALIDGAGKDLVADALVHRQAFTGDRRLVDDTLALQHHPVERHAPARPHPHDGADRYLHHRQRQPATVRLAHVGLVRRQCQQAADGIAGPVDRTRLDRLGQRVQRHHHRRLGPLADQEGSGHGHRHQRIDVEAATPQRRQPLAIDRKARQRDGRRRQAHACQRAQTEVGDMPGMTAGRTERGFTMTTGPGDQLGQQRQTQRRQQPAPALPEGFGRQCQIVGPHGPR